MALEQDDWKQKYKELAQEHEALRQSAERSRARVRTLSAQLALGLQGQSAALDAEFDLLREIMLDGRRGERLDRVLEQIERQIKLIDDQRLSSSRDIRQALERWIGQLRQFGQEDALGHLLDGIKQRVPQASEQLYRLGTLLLELVDLQQGMFARNADEHVLALNQADRDDVVDLKVLESRVGAEMIKLVEVLGIHETVQAEQLIQRLRQGIRAAELPGLMADLVGLVRLTMGLEHQEFESYLRTLDQQLSQVQAFLNRSKSEENQVFEAHQQLDQQVRQDVDRLHESVRVSNDLPTLKRSVKAQLASIVSTMDSYCEQEKLRQQQLQRRHEALLRKLQQMEVETGRVRSLMEEEQQKSHTDPLTGVPNRAALDERMAAEVDRWRRYDTPFSIAVVDLDRFKQINDQFGHLAGDKVLRLVSRVLQSNMRASDFMARFGGEEFVLLFPSTHQREALVAAGKLRLAVEKSPFNFHGQPVNITASIGVAEVKEGDSAESLFARADHALYQAKEQGRNRVYVAES